MSVAVETIAGSTPARPARDERPPITSPVCSADVTPPINPGSTPSCCAKAVDNPPTKPPDASAAATAGTVMPLAEVIA